MIASMQYLRMLTNSLVGGALVGAYVALLVLQLNPMVRLDSVAAARLMLTWAAFYGVHAAAFFYALTVVRQLLAVEIHSPGWISLRLITTFASAGSPGSWRPLPLLSRQTRLPSWTGESSQRISMSPMPPDLPNVELPSS